MTNTLRILARMRKAEVPPHAHEHSLESLGQHRASAMVSSRTFNLGDGALSSYVVTEGSRKGAPNPALVVSVIAKEFVLVGLNVLYTTLPVLLQATKDELSADLPTPGGYILVGELGENIDSLSAYDWEAVQALLLRYLSRGGGLVLGVKGPALGYFGDDMTNAFAAFDSLQVE